MIRSKEMGKTLCFAEFGWLVKSFPENGRLDPAGVTVKARSYKELLVLAYTATTD